MLTLSKQDILKITGGISHEPHGHACRGVEFDSREIKGGELFVALKGEKTHGHAFLATAYDRGAALFLIEDKEIFEKSIFKDRLILVDDTLKAFSQLAAAWRLHLGTPLIAVTGSVGKTTVKEMLAALLVRTGAGAYSQRSFNNHVGVPYTLCKLSPTHSWGVIEMGMNHAGEIEALSKMAAPDIALITRIAAAHIEAFGSIDKIADAKFEIIAGLKSDGALVLNADDDVLLNALKRHARPGQEVIYFGTEKSGKNGVLVTLIENLGLAGFRITFSDRGEKLSVSLPILGEHNAINAAAAIAAARRLKPEITEAQIVSAFLNFRPPEMRLNIKETLDGRKVLDDSYNANPVSMQAFLEVVRSLKNSGLRVGLVLGGMLELGSSSAQYHLETGQFAASVVPQFLVAVGEQGQAYLDPVRAAGIDTVAAHDVKEALIAVNSRSWDVLCVKASRGIGLDRLVGKLVGDTDEA